MGAFRHTTLWRRGEGTHQLTHVDELMLDRAHPVGLPAPEMTVLIGGMRFIGTNRMGTQRGSFTDNLGSFTNDFFVTAPPPEMSGVWEPHWDNRYSIRSRTDGQVKWTATRVDSIFSHSTLRWSAEVSDHANNAKKFVDDSVVAWHKGMGADRLDLVHSSHSLPPSTTPLSLPPRTGLARDSVFSRSTPANSSTIAPRPFFCGGFA